MPVRVSSTPWGARSVPLVPSVAAVPAGARSPSGKGSGSSAPYATSVGRSRESRVAISPAVKAGLTGRIARPSSQPRLAASARALPEAIAATTSVSSAGATLDTLTVGVITPSIPPVDRTTRRPHGARDSTGRRLEAGDSRRFHRRHVRDGRGDREDHDLPARGPQRVPSS